jgi:hypothetical protein
MFESGSQKIQLALTNIVGKEQEEQMLLAEQVRQLDKLHKTQMLAAVS